jgi:hypothetical protein
MYTQVIIGVYILLILRMAKHYYVPLHGFGKKNPIYLYPIDIFQIVYIYICPN